MIEELDWAWPLATSTGLGLLVGLERERHPRMKAGLRTFALIAMLGCLVTLLGVELGTPWFVAAAMLLVGGAVAAAYIVDPETKVDDSGTTTIVASLLVFSLGALVALGHQRLAVALAVSITAILYFKSELEGFSRKLTPQDLRAMIRFAVLSAVVLPLLPDRPLVAEGPLSAVSPYNVWLMVVLISGVSLAGYVAFRLTLGRHGLLVTGLLGGLASSTATTLVAARHSGEGGATDHASLTVILLANATMMARLMVVIAVVAPGAWRQVATLLAPALLLSLPVLAWHLRHAAKGSQDEEGAFRNPANLSTALGFGALYALVLVLAAGLGEYLGTGGIYALAAVSGLTDVDAITLSILRLVDSASLAAGPAAAAIAIAVAANLVAKTGLVYVAGTRPLGHRTAMGFLLPLAALLTGAILSAG